MADFQSSKTAQEIETVLIGAVLFNENTKLSEAQKAQARANIGATANGEGIKIISHFDTLEELEAAVKSPKTGDAYSVGSSLPYNLYIYDFLSAEWRDYGAIRSTDISARFAQNVDVGVSAWKEDTDVFTDFTYKAQIPLGEVTGNDFPIVAFAPSDAVSGNYCPIAYCFDGYVEVWAKAIPATAITIPAITFIIQDDGASGGSTKGITNASGGIATGGIGSEQIANGSITAEKIVPGAVSQTYTATIPTEGWTEGESYSSISIDAADIKGGIGYDIDVDLTNATGEDVLALNEAWGGVLRIIVDATSGKLHIDFSEVPEIDIPIKVKVVRK